MERNKLNNRRLTRITIETLESRLAPATDFLGYRGGLNGLGVIPTESSLTPSNVAVNSFGKQHSVTLDGQIYAEPLVKTGVTIANGPNTVSGAAGVHDVVFVTTQHDSVYALDATSGAILWKRNFLDVNVPANNTLGASAIKTLATTDVGSQDIQPEIGITGTPVIDGASGTLYVVTKTKETIGGVDHFVQRLHGISLSDGTDRGTPFLLGDTTNGNTNNTPIYTYGTGDGHVTDPYHGTGKEVVQFNALRENQRPALSLVNGKVYISWASHADNGPYHGWVVAIDVTKLTSTGFKLTGVFNASPNNGLAGIWQGGGSLAFEPDGSAFYFETGNGWGGAPVLNANGFPSNGNYNEALLKIVADPTTSPTNQNVNGWGFKVADFFTPHNVVALDSADSDFGAGAPVLLPDSAGIPGHPHLMVVGGKEGKLYVVDRNNLGRFDPQNDHVVNAIPDGSGHNTPPAGVTGFSSTAAWFNGKLYVVSAFGGRAVAYTLGQNGQLTAASQTANTSFGTFPGSPIITANGANSGIVWLTDRQSNVIHAYDANSFSTEIWNSNMAPGGQDSVGPVTKFAPPTVVNGMVYVGAGNSLQMFGEAQATSTAPNAPSLSASAVSGSSIRLTWTDSTQAPNKATNYSIEQSTDGTHFTEVATAPGGTTTISIGGLTPQTHYFFRVFGINSSGKSPASNVADAVTTSQAATIDFSNGFVNATSTLATNGTASVVGSRLRLTGGSIFAASSAFTKSPVDVTSFNTHFTFQMSNAVADGFTFTIQGNGPSAIGPAGGNLGYTGVAKSVAIKFDIFDNNGEGSSSTGLYVNGAEPTNAGSISLVPSGLQINNGDVYRVDMTYSGTTLAVTITDTQTNKSFTKNYSINIPGKVGSNGGYVGFTAGSGSLVAVQDILTWTFAASASASPHAPSGLGAIPASATSISLNWKANATNQVGYHLDRATDANFTNNAVSQTVASDLTAFTDSSPGLAPGSTYYYRLRAFNSAGDSDNSNVAVATIPVAPARPSMQQITGLLPRQISMSWQDNAGHDADGYRILRSVNHGAFTQVANLPPTSRKAPSTYEWTDEGLTPGTYYEYHIIAYNVSGNNDFAGLNATTPTETLPATPGALSAVAPVNNAKVQVNLSWNSVAGATGYKVYRSLRANGQGSTPLVTLGQTTSFVDTKVAPGTTYFYKVAAVNQTGIGTRSNEARATPAIKVHINFTTRTGAAVPGYIADTGKKYGAQTEGLKFGWTVDDTAGAIDRNAANSPNELHDSFHAMQHRPGVQAHWHIALPNGTYSVHVLMGDPTTADGNYRVNLDGGSDEVAVIRGRPTASNRWVENTATVKVTNGSLWLLNATGAAGNKIDAIDIQNVVPGVALPAGFAAATGLVNNGAARIHGQRLQLTSGNPNQRGSSFTNRTMSIASFRTDFDFKLGGGDGIAFVVQNAGPSAVGSAGEGLGYSGIHRSVAVKFDSVNNSGEGYNSTGLYLNGASPTNTGAVDLSGVGINLHSGHTFHVTMNYDGVRLNVTITDKVTNAKASQSYPIDLVKTVGSTRAHVGFTGGTGALTGVQEILNWTYDPTA